MPSFMFNFNGGSPRYLAVVMLETQGWLPAVVQRLVQPRLQRPPLLVQLQALCLHLRPTRSSKIFLLAVQVGLVLELEERLPAE